ncbi:xanthine phosphoribosyltransferase [Desulfosporosinus meridiei]|uniref:Xanthine phosphoribosyltransferase n=1 Tax=Desulfosporosinus meridiei (strain ATCC BAA-275 / DSM 13257 / KCTC 12902 / NCIMB 13706 / S10) TaxID=768704 RepID=J7IPF4_DESMD|nr:xanthine phosphoribosyltransferase [Desulfosporosinus meridiei]AFQ43490.1 xanthine phosphoribosyltransferase [Desulfosporosinus meridiei DSM 13257]
MELLKNKIRDTARISEDRIIQVDNFLNHQLDISLFNEIGKEFKRRFADKEITKIITIETSGIAIACITAQYFDNIPVVFAKKHAGLNMNPDVYEAKVFSYTKNQEYTIKVSKAFLSANDKVLIIDDFLASGSALLGLVSLVNQSGAEIGGVGIVIEKTFQGGRKVVEEKGVQIESLAMIDALKDGQVFFK